MLILAPKAPNETIFYDFDWATKRLEAGEVIEEAGWELSDAGAVEIADSPPPSVTDGVSRVYLKNGQIGDIVTLTSWVRTNLNPRRDFSGRLKVRQK